MSRYLKINQLAQAAEVSQDTIRHYEKIGLLPKPRRGANGYRLFDESAVSFLRFIKMCREIGFSLDEVKQLSLLKQNPEQNCRNADELAERHLRQINEKIAQLNEIKQFLEGLTQCHSHDVAHCRVLNSLSPH
ncbi:MerR family transcriptional regulator [Pasteurellaceae bacterium LIM206]|nr:MerR family transcriptional regulator [Pasteurellaceae bacterium LIM206]